MTLGFVAAFALCTWAPAMTARADVSLPVRDDLLADAVRAVGELALDAPWLTQAESQDDDGGRVDDRGARGNTSNFGGSSGGTSMGSAGSASTPQGRTFGIGIQLGYPTALSVKYMLRPDQGVAGGIGGFTGFAYDAAAFSIHADYVYHPHVLTSSEVFALTWYVGGGANLLVFSSPRQRPFLPGPTYYYFPTTVWLGARVPIGVNLAFAQQPFEIFLEAIPSLLLFPGLSFGLGASLGGRFYF